MKLWLPDNLVLFLYHSDVFGVDNSSFAHAYGREKDILVFDDGRSDGLDDTTITADVKYSINITKSRKFV